jgi:hypothetical protein
MYQYIQESYDSQFAQGLLSSYDVSFLKNA